MAQSFLQNQQKSDSIISQIVALCNGLTKDGETRSFDGVTIDFEQFYKSDLKEPYNLFLSKLSTALKKSNKKLNVAVQPNTNFKGYDYKGIGQVADKVILMAHDYAPKNLSALEMQIGSVITPITPISEIYKALKEITNVKTGISDKTKIALQISYGSTQWQLKAGQVINSKPYTPSYDKIYERLADPNTQLIYNEFYHNPYATYELDGIKNIIWFENNKSVKAKIDLAKLYGIPNVSYWRLGTIPTFE